MEIKVDQVIECLKSRGWGGGGAYVDEGVWPPLCCRGSTLTCCDSVVSVRKSLRACWLQPASQLRSVNTKRPEGNMQMDLEGGKQKKKKKKRAKWSRCESHFSNFHMQQKQTASTLVNLLFFQAPSLPVAVKGQRSDRRGQEIERAQQTRDNLRRNREQNHNPRLWLSPGESGTIP